MRKQFLLDFGTDTHNSNDLKRGQLPDIVFCVLYCLKPVSNEVSRRRDLALNEAIDW